MFPNIVFSNTVSIFWICVVWSGAEVRQSCRTRKIMRIEYLLATITFDKAENETFKVVLLYMYMLEDFFRLASCNMEGYKHTSLL